MTDEPAHILHGMVPELMFCLNAYHAFTDSKVNQSGLYTLLSAMFCLLHTKNSTGEAHLQLTMQNTDDSYLQKYVAITRKLLQNDMLGCQQKK